MTTATLSRRQTILREEKPPAHNIDVEGIAPSLIEVARWVLWKWERDKKKWTKVPCDERGNRCDAHDSANWHDFSSAERLASRGFGIGFVFNGDGIAGVDLDDCRDPDTGKLKGWAEDLIGNLGTYTEVSPSGTGVKMFVRGTLLKKFDKQYERPDGDGESEIYSTGRFFTVTGQRVYSTPDDLQDRPSQLLNVLEVFKSWKTEKKTHCVGKVPQKSFEPLHVGDDDRATALAALAVLDPNMHHEQWIKTGMALHSVDSSATMRGEWDRWSAGSPDRYTDGDCSKRWASFGGGGIGIGTLCHLAGETGLNWRPTHHSGVILDNIGPRGAVPLSTTEPTEDPIPDTVPAISPDLLQPGGLLQKIIDFNLKTAIKPQPELALAGAIALVATITGRKVEDDYGTRPNIYIVGIGASGSGKDNARRVNKVLLTSSGAEQMLQDDLASSAGLHSAMTTSPSSLLQLDEFGRFLATLGNPSKSPFLYGIVSVLLKLYSSSNSLYLGPSYADAKKNSRIPFPNCVLYGTTVPASFFGSLTREALSDGLFNRLLIVEASNSDPDLQTPEPLDAPFLLVEAVRWWLGFNPGCINLVQTLEPTARRLVTSQEAKEEFSRLDVTVRQRQRDEEKRGTQVWGRCSENARKLALIHQCSLDRESLSIGVDSARWGCLLALHLTNRVEQLAEAHVADGEFDTLGKKFLRFVREGSGRERTKTEVCRHMRGQKNRELDEVIGKLVATEEITVGTRDSKSGPAAIVYRAL